MLVDGVTLTRWREVWRAIGAEDRHRGDFVFDDLISRYGEPHRSYHTLDHIGECLRHLDTASHLLQRPSEAEIALWFHDAIYDPRRNDNEARSAGLAEEVLCSAGVNEGVARRVGDLIKLTTHAETLSAGDASVVCDADLAILGAGEAVFHRYDTAIRREYAWVPEPIFRRERGRVLAGFLARPRIYQTDYFANLFEIRARTNLRRAIKNYRLAE